MKSPAQAVIDFTLWRTREGHPTQVQPRGIFSCPAVIDEAYHDCRLEIGDIPMKPGEQRRVQAWFLYPADVLPKLSIGKVVHFWTAGMIGEGVIVDIAPQADQLTPM
ncbi:hypothetical protein [Microvirga vignae]|nr:hypothetical protein [Microvirga vignae]